MERSTVEKAIMLALVKQSMKAAKLFQGVWLDEDRLLEAAFKRFTFRFDGDSFVLVNL